MYYSLLTKSTTFLIGPIASVMGYIMNAIFSVLEFIGIPNIGLSIIIFTVLMNLVLLPFTVRQQRSSRLNSIIMPEVTAIQEKYKDKKDQESMVKMQDETKEVYARYGSSQTAGCLTSLIQLPILFALYQVIYRMPAYVESLKSAYMTIVNALTSVYPEYATSEALQELASSANVSGIEAADKMIDLMYTFGEESWETFIGIFPNITEMIEEARVLINEYNNFLTINLAERPGFSFPIIMIPILAGLFQWISTRLTMASTNSGNTGANNSQTSSTMNIMNNLMPLISVVFCFMLPAGVGLYWAASSGVRVVIQLFVNVYLKRVDLDKLIEKNVAKSNRKRERQGLPPVEPSKISDVQAHALQATREDKAKEEAAAKEKEKQKEERIRKNTEYYTQSQSNPNSIAAKAAMVQQYNERQDNSKGKTKKES